MAQARHRSLDRVGSLVIVLGGHLLLITVLSGGRLPESRKMPLDLPKPLIWIPVRREEPRNRPEQKESVPHRKLPRAAPRVSRWEPEPAIAPAQASEPTAPGAPHWNLEVQTVANSLAPRMIKELQQKCAQAEQRAQALPEGCKNRGGGREWQPEPKRAGFIGIFPYVRLGKCVVGLGFFGCAIGKRTADGALLKDISNPDRPVSSVPDLPGPIFSQQPTPLAFKEPEQP
jgi:hypothetical protein